MCDEVTNDLQWTSNQSTPQANHEREDICTWSAEMPLVKALRTLSRVNDPTTRFAKRYLRVTKRLRTAVCRGLSANRQQVVNIQIVNGGTCIRIQSIVRLQNDESFALSSTSCTSAGRKRGSG